jgi:hypothetical protein
LTILEWLGRKSFLARLEWLGMGEVILGLTERKKMGKKTEKKIEKRTEEEKKKKKKVYVKKLSKSCQKVAKKLSTSCQKIQGFPRPGGDFIAPGKKSNK